MVDAEKRTNIAMENGPFIDALPIDLLVFKITTIWLFNIAT